jgi:pyruvate dehydrogenase E1 component alpha subunit
MAVDNEILSTLFRKMILVRRFEKRLEALVFNARVPCSGHFGLGQEGVGVGVSSALATSDYLFGTHRGFAEYIGKGLTPKEILCEYYGKATSLSRGRLGQHLLKVEIGIMPLPSSLGSEFGMAVGVALSSSIRGTGQVTLNLFGEGTASQPDCYASLEMAALWKVPLVFACNNNQYVELDSHKNISTGLDVAIRAQAFGIPFEIVDGNDVGLVWETTVRAVEKARKGEGATFLEFKTYRRSTHYTGDPGGYQPQEEIAKWAENDPVDRCRAELRRRGALDEAQEKAIIEAVDSEIEEAVQFAENSPYPAPETAFTGLYA